jgi:hypothetical protein
MTFDKSHLIKLCELNELFEADTNPLNRDDNPLRMPLNIMTAQARSALAEIQRLEEAVIIERARLLCAIDTGCSQWSQVNEKFQKKYIDEARAQR